MIPPIIACNIKSEKTGDIFTLNLNYNTYFFYYTIELSDIVKYFDFIKSHNNDTFDPLFIRVVFNTIKAKSTYTIENVYKLEDFINIFYYKAYNNQTFYFYYINKKFINTKTDNVENINFIKEVVDFTDNIFYNSWTSKASDETKNSLQKDLNDYNYIIVHIDNINGLNQNIGTLSHVEGCYTTSSNFTTHAEGHLTTAEGMYSHAEGLYSTATGGTSHAEGWYTRASGVHSHSECSNTRAKGENSHAEGNGSDAVGDSSHAEGSITSAVGDYSHSEGSVTLALSECSHTGNNYTIADINNMTAIGSYNKPNYNIYTNNNHTVFIIDNNTMYTIAKSEDGTTYTATHNTTGEKITGLELYAVGEETLRNKIFVIGNGTSNDNRKDAFVITNTGDVYISGTIHCKEIIHDM